MKVKSRDLLNELKHEVEMMLVKVDEIERLSLEQLESRPDEKSWNILECFEHMNLYGAYYIGEIDYRITESKNPSQEYFKCAGFGNYSAKSMLPKKAGKVNMAMKTFPKMDPKDIGVRQEVIITFKKDMNQMLNLIERAKSVGLRKTKCKLWLRWLKFNLGDTLRFMVYHNMRHMIQIEKLMIKSI